MMNNFNYTVTNSTPEHFNQYSVNNRFQAIAIALQAIEQTMYRDTDITLVDNTTGELLLCKADNHGKLYLSADTLTILTAVMEERWGEE